jgi:hypothetical protein
MGAAILIFAFPVVVSIREDCFMSISRQPHLHARHLGLALLASLALLAGSPSASAGDAFSNLGGALPGINGNPLLQGAGSLQASTAAFVSLSNAKGSSPAVMFLSFASTPVPFKGGLLQTIPLALAIPLTTDSFGMLGIGFVTPPGLPAGLEFFLQAAIQDSAAVQGVALSNALRALVPEPGPVIDSFLPVQGGSGTPITLNGSGFSSDPANVVGLVGGLLMTPVSGSPTHFTGILPVVPPPDISAEPIVVKIGEGRLIGSGADSPGDGGGLVIPPFPGINTTGTGMVWNDAGLVQSFTTSDLFEKTTGIADVGVFINEYLPNLLLAGNEIHLPLGTVNWTENTRVHMNLFIVLDNGKEYAIALNDVTFTPGSPAQCASALAALINFLMGQAGWVDAFAIPVQVSPGVFEIHISPIGGVGIVGACGGWVVVR